MKIKSDHKEYRAVMLEQKVAERLKSAKEKSKVKTISEFINVLLEKE